MTCPRCGSENVSVVMDTSQKVKQSGCLWSIGRLILVVCTLGLWLIIPKRVGHTKSKPIALCQSCGKKFRA